MRPGVGGAIFSSGTIQQRSRVGRSEVPQLLFAPLYSWISWHTRVKKSVITCGGKHALGEQDAREILLRIRMACGAEAADPARVNTKDRRAAFRRDLRIRSALLACVPNV